MDIQAIKVVWISRLQYGVVHIPDKTPTTLIAAVVPREGRIIKNGVFEGEENLLQNGIPQFVFNPLSAKPLLVFRLYKF